MLTPTVVTLMMGVTGTGVAARGGTDTTTPITIGTTMALTQPSMDIIAARPMLLAEMSTRRTCVRSLLVQHMPLR